MLPNNCYDIEGYDILRDGSSYTITLHSSVDANVTCSNQSQETFTTMIPLNAFGIEVGTYQIIVNGSIVDVSVGYQS